MASDPKLMDGAYAYAALDADSLPVEEMSWSQRLPKDVELATFRTIWSWSLHVDWADERSVAMKAVHPHHTVAKYEIAGNEWVADLTRPTKMLIGTIGQSRLTEVANQMRWEYIVSRKAR